MAEQGITKFKRLSPTQVDEIKELARSGKTSSELAEQFNCSSGTIDRHLKNAGLANPEKRFSHLTVNQKKRLKEFVELGWKHEEIAQELGCDRTSTGQASEGLRFIFEKNT